MRHFYLLLFWSIFLTQINAQSLYFPPNTGTAWDTLAPSTLGYCDPQVDSLNQYLDRINTKAFILLKDGKIVLEQYFDGFTQDSVWYWASAGKSLTAYLVGIAQEEGFLSISDTSSQYLGTGWTNTTPTQEQAITVWHQLTMTTGLDDGVSNMDCTLDTCLQYLAAPGTRWAYHNAPYTLLDGVIEQSTGRNLNTYLTQKIKRTTGMKGVYLSLGYNNVYFSDARSFARFGLLTLAKGNWNGTPVLSDTAYFRQMTTPSQAINQAYGYLWWLNGQSTYRLPQSQFTFSGSMAPAGPTDCIMALGKNGQIVSVVPSQNLVWVRMGDAPGTGLVPQVHVDTIWQKINQLVCTPLSTTQTPVAEDLQVFPNPSQGQVTIQSSQRIQRVEVYNNLGQLVHQRQGGGGTALTLDLSATPRGHYCLRIEDARGALHTRQWVHW